LLQAAKVLKADLFGNSEKCYNFDIILILK